MIKHNVKQGSPEWLALREGYLTASNAATIMGDGYDSRDKAIRYALGIDVKEITPHLQKLFDQGHEYEDKARGSLSEKLKAVVATADIDGLALLASFDGINEEGDLVWEHKFTTKEFDEIPPLYYWQLEHQMLVAGCTEAVLTVTSRKDLSITHYDYESVPARREQLIGGWHKWLEDLENYQRTDSEWLDLAQHYIDTKEAIDSLTKTQNSFKARLQELAGKHSASGGGVKVSVSEQWTSKQTAAAYIKEHGVDLPEKQLDNPKINYRITTEKAA